MSSSHFWYRNEQAYCESVPVARIVEEYGSPLYIYSKAQLVENCRALKAAFSIYPTLPCYAVKANTNASLLRIIFEVGFGADVVSVGEMQRALLAGAPPQSIVFSGVGKQAHEIKSALEAGIFSFNVESASELGLIHQIASDLNKVASVMLRINPNIDVKTNPYIATGLYSTKFGITEEEALMLSERLVGNEVIKLIGISCHIGSQICELTPFQNAAARMAQLALTIKAQGHDLKAIDLGGGLGISYHGEAPPTAEEYAKTLVSAVRKTELNLVIEPGRSVVGTSGILATKVVAVKKTPMKQFVIVDAAMNDLIRPSLYEAYHAIEPAIENKGPVSPVDVVGPVCETGDLLGLDRELPVTKEGDLLIIRDTGAYGASMASNYNSRGRAPEVLVDGSTFKLIRRREALQDLLVTELQ